MAGGPVHRSLSAEIRDRRSPVRRFLHERFGAGLRGVQRRYRESVPQLAVPQLAVPPRGSPAGTVAVAARWLLRFLLHPAPDLDLVLGGVRCCRAAGIELGEAVTGVVQRLGMTLPIAPGPVQHFTGPIPGSPAEPAMLARACWCFGLLTEAYRGGTGVRRARSPLRQLRGRRASSQDLLDLAPAAALAELADLRAVFTSRLLPALAARPGRWALGPVFAGSRLLAADADLAASGLLLQLKVTVHASLAADDLFQLIAYPLLDFTDGYRIRDLGYFSARTGHLATWQLKRLLTELAGQPVDLAAARAGFRNLLEAG
ncbi:MAG: hypothetical protein J2P34_04335 [Actinobacteria bacterium]|nr:hypothetical protein [Actinomycetota bacterium]